MTYTILALDRARTAIGVAVASRSLAAGATVPMLDPALGAAASQAWTNSALRRRMLDEPRRGVHPEEAVQNAKKSDADSKLRQLAVLGLDGSSASFTGEDTTEWRGHLIANGIVALGNFLTGPAVLEAMLESFGEPVGLDQLSEALVGALAAGERAGGDSRGRQSAAILTADYYAEEASYALRVDDDEDPVGRLRELVALRKAAESHFPLTVTGRDRP